METLLPYFERELVMLRRHCREFAERYPRIAGQLQMSGDACEDPHVERLIQSVALLAARIARRLDDDYPQFTDALLDPLFPHYLRPFPSCAIVRLPPAARRGGQGLPAGTLMDSAPVHGVPCRFTTAYDIALGEWHCRRPLRRQHQRAAGRAPAGGRQCGDRITIARHGAPPPALRLFIDGEPSFSATLHDTLFMHAACAFVEDAHGPWLPLPALPLAPAGFAEERRPDAVWRAFAPRLPHLGRIFRLSRKIQFLRYRPGRCTRSVCPPAQQRHPAPGSDRTCRQTPTGAHAGQPISANLLPGCTPVHQPVPANRRADLRDAPENRLPRAGARHPRARLRDTQHRPRPLGAPAWRRQQRERITSALLAAPRRMRGAAGTVLADARRCGTGDHQRRS